MMINVKNFPFSEPSGQPFSKFLHPRINHYFLLLKFLLFSFLFPALDIYTDILTASYFFWRKQFYWGSCTTLFIFLPFVARICIFFYQRFSHSTKLNSNWLSSTLRQSAGLIWHIPLFTPIR